MQVKLPTPIASIPALKLVVALVLCSPPVWHGDDSEEQGREEHERRHARARRPRQALSQPAIGTSSASVVVVSTQR